MKLALSRAGTESSLRRSWLVLIVATSAVILMPQVFRFVPLPPVNLEEHRELAPLPKLPTDFLSLQTFPQKLNEYIQDNFPLRSQIIAHLNYIRFLAGYSSQPKVIVGRDGWLFYDNGSHLAEGIGRTRLSQTELSDWIHGLKQRLSYAKSKGFGLYVLPAPQQESIYPEKLPGWLARQAQPTTEIDQILDAATKQGVDEIVDVRPPLVAAKATRRVYGPYDTHWNGNGAYIAYHTLMTRISRDYPDLTPLPQSGFAHHALGDNVLAAMLGIANFVEDDAISYLNWPLHDEKRTIFLADRKDWTAPQILETDSTSNRTLLLIRDSFSNELIPLLKPHFSRMIVVHVDDGFFRRDLIERYHPDIVIVEVIEDGFRYAMHPLSEPSQ